MDALDLIVLGRQLARIGEDALRGSRSAALPTGQSLVLRDVFANPGSSITEITGRTGLPQSYASESVARLRERGLLETATDPADGRRTLVRVTRSHARTVARRGAAPIDATLAQALGEGDASEVIAMLEALRRRLVPAEPGPILAQIDAAG